MKYLIFFLIGMSLVLFVVMGVDKFRAQRHKWRITERTLLLLAAVGGALGGCLGMLLFRHKTRHTLFRWSFPLLLVLEIVIVTIVWKLKLLT